MTSKMATQALENNPLAVIRKKYADDLEEILQCPVCFDRLTGLIPVCSQGHHVCFRCQTMLDNCPLCKFAYIGARNYLAENLSVKFEEIKGSLLDPDHPSNKAGPKIKVSTETQTDTMESQLELNYPILNGTPKIKISCVFQDKKNQPNIAKGKYPCHFEGCSEELVHGRMIPHIRYYHNDKLVEVARPKSNFYHHSWELKFVKNQNYDYALNVPTMGLFFLKVNLNNEGNLYGYISMVNSKQNASKFQYILEICVNQNSIRHSGVVQTCRISSAKLRDKCLFIPSATMAYILKKKDIFICNLNLIYDLM